MDFDAQMRSILADAEVKPSHRVWKGVSARLDADAAPVVRPWGWMKWAGMSLAAAAAIAAGLFFTGTRHSIPTNYYNQEQSLIAQAGEPAGAAIDIPVEAPAAAPAEEAAEVAAATHPARRNSPAARAAAPISSVTESPATEAPAPSDDPGVAPAEAQTKQPAANGGSAPVRRSADTRNVRPVADPFAEPAVALVPRKASGIDLYAQGTLGSNDSDFRQALRSAFMAPGESTGFTEQGASSYGIPFTLGVGVRFHLTPRLSLGTGLDYSLLSRTFAGSYGDMSGSVSHTMHYLGVPVRLYYDVISAGKIDFYVYGGGEIEYCVSNQYRMFANPDIVKKYPVAGPQLSAGAGLGVEFRLTRQIGLYFDPGINYYFPGNQPKSIRTEKPFLLNFDAGVRFNFGR